MDGSNYLPVLQSHSHNLLSSGEFLHAPIGYSLFTFANYPRYLPLRRRDLTVICTKMYMLSEVAFRTALKLISFKTLEEQRQCPRMATPPG